LKEIILDSGVFIASLFPEKFSPEARQLLTEVHQRQISLQAPTLIVYEFVSVVRKLVYQGRDHTQDGQVALEKLLAYPIGLHRDTVLLKRAYELSEIHNRPRAYDSQYLALAERLQCDFWTADERLFNAIQGKLPYIYWLGNGVRLP
jgi:predicted nucleic acid-binding protein